MRVYLIIYDTSTCTTSKTAYYRLISSVKAPLEVKLHDTEPIFYCFTLLQLPMLLPIQFLNKFLYYYEHRERQKLLLE